MPEQLYGAVSETKTRIEINRERKKKERTARRVLSCRFCMSALRFYNSSQSKLPPLLSARETEKAEIVEAKRIAIV